MILLLSLISCIVPEKGIDNTRLVGTLRIEPSHVDESSDTANDGIQSPFAMDPLHFGYRTFTGTLLTSTADETTGEATGDVDHWLLVTPNDRTGDAPLAVDITLADVDARARVRVYNLDETTGVLNEPTLVHEEEFTQWALVEFEAEADVNYSFGIYGLEGPDDLTYDCFALGRHPDEARVLVGAYENDDPEDRGALLAGTNAKEWTTAEGLAFETWYEMLLVRKYQTPDSGEVVIDENVKQAYVYAGTWANLSQGLPAGTFYSRKPVLVDLTKKADPELHGTPPETVEEAPGDTGAPSGGKEEDNPAEPLIKDTPRYPTVTVDEPVAINTIADAVIGQVWDEATTEPNDTDIGDSFQDPSGAFDLGMLSGPGFVDVIDNASLEDNGTNEWSGDNDTFKFQVPAPTRLNFTLSWADPAIDFDVLVVDAEGNVIDLGYYGFPEIPYYGTEVLQPGQDYYIAALLWIGTGNAGDQIPYDLTLEQLPE